MQLQFYKYHGAGNDFILIDDRQSVFDQHNETLIKSLCDRRFGIGADGLMLLRNENGVDFKMIYFNADGRESTMCGNGGRCITLFAHHLGLISHKTTFTAIDGLHEAVLDGDQVNLKMTDVPTIEEVGGGFVLDTGSPHFVRFTEYLDQLNVKEEGSTVRYSERFRKEGINVNFVQPLSDQHIRIRTYERGVEDETLACGTGVTAAALVFGRQQGITAVDVDAEGGALSVRFEIKGDGFTNIWLKGPAAYVFKGTTDV